MNQCRYCSKNMDLIKRLKIFVLVLRVVASFSPVTIFRKGYPINGKGIGLKTIEDRVKLLEGKVEVDSTSGKGTLITIILPFHPNRSSYIKKNVPLSSGSVIFPDSHLLF